MWLLFAQQGLACPVCHTRRALTEPSQPATAGAQGPSWHETMLDVGLEMHGLSEDEQEALSCGQYTVPGRHIFFVFATPHSWKAGCIVAFSSTCLEVVAVCCWCYKTTPTVKKGTAHVSGLLFRINVNMEYPHHSAQIWTVFGSG